MLLRILRGRVRDGSEARFVEIARRQVAEGARAAGLLAVMCGYRRVARADEFLLVSTWETEAAATRTAGEQGNPRAAKVLAEVATVDAVDVYGLLPPVFRGVLDAPGAVIRLVSALVRPGEREALLRYIDNKEREFRGARMLLGWAIGERQTERGLEITSAVAWPSPLMIELMAEPGREGMTLFADVDRYISDVHIAQFQAIELRLPSRLADVSSRRVLAARFETESAANIARAALSSIAHSASEAGISVARLGSEGRSARPDDPASDRHVLVARLSVEDYPAAERAISDNEGQIILASDERAPLDGSAAHTASSRGD